MALQTGTKHYLGSFEAVRERFQNPNIEEELSVPFKVGSSLFHGHLCCKNITFMSHIFFNVTMQLDLYTFLGI